MCNFGTTIAWRKVHIVRGTVMHFGFRTFAAVAACVTAPLRRYEQRLKIRTTSSMVALRATLALIGLVLFSTNVQAAFITDASAIGGTFTSSAARAQNGVPFGGAGSNFACAGGGTSTAGGTAVSNSTVNTTCQSGRAFATTDLVTGSLGGFAFSSGTAGTTANTTSLFSDTVTFNNSTGGNLLLDLSYLSHGTVAGETGGVSTTTRILSQIMLSEESISPHDISLLGSTFSRLSDGLRFDYVNGSATIQAPAAGGTPSLGGWTISPVVGI